MKNLAYLAVCLSLFAVPAGAQTNQPAGTKAMEGTRVAVIDIGKVFKQHPGFNQAMETMKRDVQQSQGELQQRAKEIQALRDKLKVYQPDSAEAKQVEAQILEMQAAGQLEATKKKKDLLDREAKLYYEVYEEIKQEVNGFMQQYGIALVLRFNSDAIDVKNRPAVLEYVNRPVVMERRIDITSQIVERIASRHKVAANPAAAAAAPRR